LHLAGFVESLDHVCCRYRLKAFAPLLAQSGHHLHLTPLPRGWWQRLALGRDAVDADALIVQRKLLTPLESGLLRRRARKLIFDFDDAVWLRDSYAAKGMRDPRRTRRFRAFVSQCDIVVAGNAFLADYTADHAPDAHISVIPTCVDTHRYQPATHSAASGRATLAWIGSSSTLKGLEAIQPLLEKLGDALPGLSLRLVCDRFLELKQLRQEEIPWSEAAEAEQLSSADIGISHLPDDLWSRGKCGLKILQYMAAGLPVVANSVGVQATMVRHGVTGFLADTEAEWIEAIRLLSGNPDLRRQMGRAGRQVVEREYSVKAGVRQWSLLLDSMEKERLTA